MKTATVTWITYNNYGTALQAYALQRFLEDNGVENVIISDKEIVERAETTVAEISSKVSVMEYLRHPMRLFFRWVYSMQAWKRKQKGKAYYRSQLLFEHFRQRDLKLLYGMKREDMPKLNKEFDAFLCGSDQIWSVLDYNFDGYFYLDFAQKKKISYAASIGTENITAERQTCIERYLQDFSAISVREKQSSQQLTNMLGRTVEWVADPTLLQDTSFWETFCKEAKTPKRKYILCYFLNNQPWYFEYAQRLADHLGIKWVLIPSRNAYSWRKETWRNATGPREFVGLFRNAEFVLTDSYHGSIFAMQFSKQFLHLKRFAEDDPICQNIRIHSLFSLVELENVIITEKIFAPEDISDIDYEAVQGALAQHRATSQEFIKKYLWE